MEISKKDMKILLKAQQGELDAVLMYNALAQVAKIQKDKDTFRQLAKEEGHHASVFHKLTQTEYDADTSKAYYASVTTNSNVTGTYAGLVTSTKNKTETLKAIGVSYIK